MWMGVYVCSTDHEMNLSPTHTHTHTVTQDMAEDAKNELASRGAVKPVKYGSKFFDSHTTAHPHNTSGTCLCVCMCVCFLTQLV
jgi:hypothetical protein